MLGRWYFRHVLVLVALVLLALAFLASTGHWLHNWEAWTTAALFAFVAVFLPWREAP